MVKIIIISPLALVGARSLVASLALAAWIRHPCFTWSLPQIGGGLSLALAQIFFVIATRETTAANAIFIQYTAPVYVAFFGIWFLGERARLYDWLTMAVIGVGLYLFFSGEFTPRGAWGDVSALLSGLALAWLFLFLRKQTGFSDTSTAETILLGNIMAAVIGLPFLIWQTPTTADWAGILYLGLFQIGLGFALMSVAIKHLAAVEAVLIQTLEPIFNPIWVFLVIGESPGRLELVGGVIVLAAVTARAIVASRQATVVGGLGQSV